MNSINRENDSKLLEEEQNQNLGSDSDDEQVGNTYFGIQAKPGVSRLNILCIFFLQFYWILIAIDFTSL